MTRRPNLPARPLLRLAALATDLPAQDEGHRVDDCTDAMLAATFGVSRRTLCRWRREGLARTCADRAAVALNLHPLNVWPEWR